MRIVVTLLWEHSSLLRVLIDQWVAQWGAGMGAEQRPVHLDLHLTTACEGSVLSLFIASVYSAVYAANQTLHLSLR